MSAEKDTRTRAHRRRQMHQDQLRLILSNQKHLEHVVKKLDEVGDLTREMSRDDLERIKVYITGKMKVVNKYLPDLSNVEWVGDLESNVVHTIDKEEAKNIVMALEKMY